MKIKRPEIILTVVGVLLLLAAVFSYLRHQREKGEEVVNYPHKIHGGPCPGETQTLTQHDPYMRGVLEPGQQYKVIMNYYDCHPVKDGDLVLYSLSKDLEPVVKYVRAMGGDHFRLSRDKKMKAWNLVVNDDMVLNETDHQPYFFGGEMPATLSLYEKSHKGVLHGDEVILLGSWGPGDNDSGIFGVFNTVDIVGKVELTGSAEPAATPEQAPHAVTPGTPVKAKAESKAEGKTAAKTGAKSVKSTKSAKVPKAAPPAKNSEN